MLTTKPQDWYKKYILYNFLLCVNFREIYHCFVVCRIHFESIFDVNKLLWSPIKKGINVSVWKIIHLCLDLFYYKWTASNKLSLLKQFFDTFHVFHIDFLVSWAIKNMFSFMSAWKLTTISILIPQCHLLSFQFQIFFQFLVLYFAWHQKLCKNPSKTCVWENF